MAPLPDLDQLAALASQSLSDPERVDLIARLEDLKAAASAAQARLAADLDASVRRHHAGLGLPHDQHGRGVASQVALARRESPARGSRLLGLARALANELPHTLGAMSTGGLSEWRATLIARETACLSAEDRQVADRRLCAVRSDGTHPFDGWGDRRLVAETQKIVLALDPHAVVNRRAKAETERRVSLRPAPDTMAQLSALLPAAQGVAVWATLTRVADSLTSTGDPRSRGQIMADTLVERVTGQPAAAAVPITVNLVISDQALLAGGHEPAWLQGYGPIPADAIDPTTFTALRRLYATPDTGQLVAMESTTRTYPTSLGLYLELRDQACRSPYCDAPIRHHDHIVRRAAAGATSGANGQGLCEQCNYAKEAPGWRTRPITGPPDGHHTVQTTTPTGHTVRSVAPAQPIPMRLQPASPAEFFFSQLVLAC